MLAVAAGPPECGVIDARAHNSSLLAGHDAHRARGAGHLAPHHCRLRFAAVGPLELQVAGQHPGRGLHGGQRTNPREADPGPGLDPDRLPDAGGGDIWTPVPAIVGGHLANAVERVLVGVRSWAELLGEALGGVHGRLKLNNELVLTLEEKRAHIESVAAVLVSGVTHDGPVHCHGRHRVQSLGDQVVPCVPVVSPAEARGVGPAGPPDPGHASLVVAVQRVNDDPGAKEVGVHLAGHRGTDGVCCPDDARSLQDTPASLVSGKVRE